MTKLHDDKIFKNLPDDELKRLSEYLISIQKERIHYKDQKTIYSSKDFDKLVCLVTELSDEKVVTANIKVDFILEAIYELPFPEYDSISLKQAKSHLGELLADSYDTSNVKELHSELNSKARKLIKIHSLATKIADKSGVKSNDIFKKAVVCMTLKAMSNGKES